MNIDVVHTYLNRKTKYITRYAKIILKSLYKAQSDNTETIEKCVSKYFDYFVLNNEIDMNIQNKSEEFCANNNIKKEYDKKIVYVIFEAIPQLKDIKINDEYSKSIITLLKIINSAIKLEEYTTSIVNENITFALAINKLEKEEHLFKGEEKWNDVAKVKKELKIKVDENVKQTKKIISLLKEDPFYLEGYQVYDTNESTNIYLEVGLKFDLLELENYDSKLINETYLENALANEHFLITLDKLLLIIFKGMIDNKNYSQFIVDLPKEFLSKKTSLKKLLNITNITYLKSKISLKIDGFQLDKYEDEIKQLKESGYNIALDDVSYLNNNVGRIRLFANYLYIDNDILSKRREVIPISEEVGIILINKEKSKEAVFIDL